MANTYLTRTIGTPTLGTKFTYSAWVKRSSLGAVQTIANMWADSNNLIELRFDLQDNLSFYAVNSSSYVFDLETTAVFRDTSAWYHIVAKVDTTQSTSSDRCKLYVNGSEQTSLSASDYPSQNLTFSANASGNTHYVGAKGNASAYFDGSMSHIHFVDGTAYPASTFGETDATTGEWKINTSPSVTMGTNGFLILKDGNTITDQSANSNDWTLSGGTLTNTEDNPSNVFCTFNPLIRPVNIFYAKGNTRIEILSGNSWQSGFGTLGMEKGQGKYYMEFKIINGTKAAFGIADFKGSGLIDRVQRGENRYIGEYANSYAYHHVGNFYYNGSSTSSGWDSFTTANIIGMAVDMDNMKLYFHKDGTYQNSGNPTAGTGGYSINDPENCYLPAVAIEANAACANFGNGSFDGTAISSEGTNASGNGKFEYDVPANFTALSTKGLNE